MAYTILPAVSAGETISSTDWGNVVKANIEALKAPPSHVIERDNGSRYSTTSTDWVSVDAVNLKATVTTTGGDVDLRFQGVLAADSASSRYAWFDFRIDGEGGYAVDQGFAGGLIREAIQTLQGTPIHMCARVAGLPPGVHTFEVIWRQLGGTAYLHSDSDDANPDIEQPLLLIAVER